MKHPKRVFVTQGALYCATQPAVITTVLGSCVAVCLWDRHRTSGGLNHFLLPVQPSGSTEPLRYGDIAIDRLIAEMESLGSSPDHLWAKVFGGASSFAGSQAESDIGARNVEMALGRLQRHGIPVVSQRTGGRRGIQLRFLTWTGEALIRAVPQQH